MAISRGTLAVTGAGTTLVVARMLGPDGAGAYALALTLLLLSTVAASLGVEHGIAYFVSNGTWAREAAFRASVQVGIFSGLVVAGAVVGARMLMPAAFGGLDLLDTSIAAAGAPFLMVWYFTSWVALAGDRYEAYGVLPAVQSILALALVPPLASGLGARGAVTALTASEIVTAAAAIWWGRRAFGAPGDHREPRGMLRRALAFGVKGYGANALQLLNFRVDMFVLSAVAGVVAVGQYAVAVSIAGILLLLPQALSEVLFPRVAALAAGDDPALVEQVEQKSLRHGVLLSTGVAIVLAGALILLVVPLYGPEFGASGTLGLILLPGLALLGVGGTLSAAIVGRGRPGISLWIALISTPVTLALYALLIPAWDAKGAATASSVSYAVTFGLSLLAYSRLAGRPALRTLAPTRDEWADYARMWRGVRRRGSHST